MKNKKYSHSKPAKLLGTERIGLLVTCTGAHAEIKDEQGQLIRCHIRKNADPVITGDEVYWLPEQDGSGIIVGHLPRKSLLFRAERADKKKLIAANIDMIVITMAPPPVLAEHMLDRYLVAAEWLKISPIILLNKMDLLDEATTEDVAERLAVYKKIGYPVLYSSTYSQEGMAELKALFHDKTGVLVGASGVGKSSLIAALTQESSIRTAEVSAAGLGKHTTTTTRLYALPEGGHLIDSPGVREFALGHISKEEVLQGFIEFKPFLAHCKFRNCQHQKELGCAVLQAVTDQHISEKRFASYSTLLADLAHKTS